MGNILKSMPIFKTKFATVILFFSFCLLVFHSNWLEAMTEDEYASMAAENLVLMHQAQGNAQALQKATEDFLKKFPKERVEEYIAMAQHIMQDEALARRISERVISILTSRGYKIKTGAEAEVGSIAIEP